MQYKAIAELIVAGRPGLSDYKLRVALLHAIEFALENKAPHCAMLEGVGVLDAKILEPEQTFQIVPAAEDTEPAAAGEEELQDQSRFADVDQFRQIAPIIRAIFPGVDVRDMKLHQTTVIVAKVGFPDGTVGSITISLPDGIANILD